MTKRAGFHFTVNVVGCGILFGVVAGCGENRVEVSGTVMLDSEPLVGAIVYFIPEDEEKSPSMGTTDEQGRYTLFQSDEPGAVVGNHRVRISTYKDANPYAEPPTQVVPERVPAKYNINSTLTAEVRDGASPIDFDLESDAPERP